MTNLPKPLIQTFLFLIASTSFAFAQGTGSTAIKQPGTQDIEQRWKSSPEFKRFNELGGEKSAEAMQIKENTVKRIAEEKLRPFIDGFDERIRERNKNRVSAYPATIQVMLANAYEAGFPLIKEKSQRNINIFNGGIVTYIDNVYNGTGNAEQAAKILLKRFPEMEGSEFQKRILSIGHNIDETGKNLDEARAWNEINRLLKSIK